MRSIIRITTGPALLTLLLTLTAFGFAQTYESAIAGIYLDDAGSRQVRLQLPLIGYVDSTCQGEAVQWLGEWELDNLNYYREGAPLDNNLPFLVLDDTCLTFPDLSRGEASAAVAKMIADVGDMGLGDLRAGYGLSQYDWIERSPEPPNVVGISFQVFSPEPGLSSLAFGYLFFEYDPALRNLHLHQHRYFANYEPL